MRTTSSAGRMKWINSIYSRLSLDQKIGQLVCDRDRHMLGAADLPAYLRQYPVGSVFIGGETIYMDEDQYQSLMKTREKIQAGASLPIQFCSDCENGVGRVVRGLTELPEMMALGATFDPKLAFQYGAVTGREARMLGIRWTFSPVVDLSLNRNNPITSVRSIGDHPAEAVAMLKEIVLGLQSEGVAATAKHFPGDGVDDRDQHIVTSLNTLIKKDWHRLYGRVYQELIDAGLYSIMIGHIGLPAFEGPDQKTGKFAPATVSRRLMTELLRKKLGFEGIIVTDALTMGGFCTWADYEQRMLACFNAGADIFLWPDTPRFFDLMRRALDDGRASLVRLEESVKRVLMLKALLNLDVGKEPPKWTHRALTAGQKLSTTIAEQSVTLLRNRAGLLPLKLAPNSRLLMLTMTPNETVHTRLMRFKDLFVAKGYRVIFLPIEKLHSYQNRMDRFAGVFLLYDFNPRWGAGVRYLDRHRGLLWSFMAAPVKHKIRISFGSPYLLHDTISSDTYINAYSSCDQSQVAAARAVLGEIPFRGRSPVECEHVFNYKEGILLQRRSEKQNEKKSGIEDAFIS